MRVFHDISPLQLLSCFIKHFTITALSIIVAAVALSALLVFASALPLASAAEQSSFFDYEQKHAFILQADIQG